MDCSSGVLAVDDDEEGVVVYVRKRNGTAREAKDQSSHSLYRDASQASKQGNESKTKALTSCIKQDFFSPTTRSGEVHKARYGS